MLLLSCGLVIGLTAFSRFAGNELRPNPCYSEVDWLLSVTATAQIVYIIYWVTKVCKKLEKMQEEELLLDRNQGSGLRLNSLLALDLSFLWDRLSRFQLLLYSLLFATASWTGKTMVYSLFLAKYSEVNSCEITYSLLVNKVSLESMPQRWITLSVMELSLVNLLMYVFPTLFMLSTIECSLIKVE